MSILNFIRAYIYPAILLPPFILGFLFFLYAWTRPAFLEPHIKAAEALIRKIPLDKWITFGWIYGGLILLIILERVLFTGYVIWTRDKEAKETLFKQGWVTSAPDAYQELLKKYPRSKILHETQIEDNTPRKYYVKGNAVLFWGRKVKTQKGYAFNTDGAAETVLIINKTFQSGDVLFLGGRHLFYTPKNFKKIDNSLGYGDVYAKDDILSEDAIQIAKLAFEISNLRTNANKDLQLEDDKKPYVEVFDNGAVIRFVGPWNKEFVSSFQKVI